MRLIQRYKCGSCGYVASAASGGYKVHEWLFDHICACHPDHVLVTGQSPTIMSHGRDWTDGFHLYDEAAVVK